MSSVTYKQCQTKQPSSIKSLLHADSLSSHIIICYAPTPPLLPGQWDKHQLTQSRWSECDLPHCICMLCAMCAIAPHCGFFGVSPDANCAYVRWGSFTSNSSSVRRAIWFTWFSEPHDTTSLHACPSVYSTWCVPGGHPSNYGPGLALLNFSVRANTDELTPYSVYMHTTAQHTIQNPIMLS